MLLLRNLTENVEELTPFDDQITGQNDFDELLYAKRIPHGHVFQAQEHSAALLQSFKKEAKEDSSSENLTSPEVSPA